MKQIYIIRKESEKKKGVYYTQMYIDLGYQQVPITFDMGLIAQLCNLTHEQVCMMELNKAINVGEFKRKEIK